MPDLQFDLYRRIYSDERDRPYKFDHRPNIRVRLDRGSSGYTIVTNAEGLREERDHNRLDSSVIFLGDSIVEGSSVENSGTLDSIFEQETGVTALNFGVSSRGTYLEYEYLKAKYKPFYNARVVVLGYCVNDLAESTYVRAFDSRRGNWYLYRYLDGALDLERGALFRLSRWPAAGPLVSWLHESWTSSGVGKRVMLRRVPAGAAVYAGDMPPNVRAVDVLYTDHHLRLLQDFTRSIGAELFVALFPTRDQLARERREKRIQDVVIELLLRRGIPYLDLFPAFQREMARAPERRWFHDDIHPAEPGHRLAGTEIARELQPRLSREAPVSPAR